MKYIASCSFGKDSLATILTALHYGEPLNEVLYCELMFTHDISAEVPEHRDFIYNTAIPAIKRMGLRVTVLHPSKTLTEHFYTRRTERSKYCGKMIGFPMVGKCELNGFKVATLNRYWKEQGIHVIQYVGIAADEKKRLARLHKKPGKISLLEKYQITESKAFEICREKGLLSPIYTFTNRNGCFFCPNTRDDALRHLRNCHPDLWNRLLEMGRTENTIRANFRINESLEQIEQRFEQEEKSQLQSMICHHQAA